MSYNIMLRNPLLFAIILACGLLLSAGFNIKVGLASQLLHRWNVAGPESITEGEIFLAKAFIFPYQVYEMHSKSSLRSSAKSFIFVKVDYELLDDSFQLQEHSLKVDEYQMLYHAIPQAIFFEGEVDEDLELIHIDPSLMNNQFIIKNSTVTSNGKERSEYNINFYSLQITKFLEKNIKTAQKEVDKAMKQEFMQGMESFKGNQTLSSEEYIATLLTDETFFYPNQLIHSEANIPRLITNETLWAVQYDGFSIYFASASLTTNSSDSKAEKILDLYIMVYRKGEDQRTHHIKQPINYLALTRIKHLDLCFSNERLKLLLADEVNLYLIDITTSHWNPEVFKIQGGYNSLHFDGLCQVLKVVNQSVSEVNGLNRIKYDHNIQKSFSLQNFLVFCQEGDICSVHSKSTSKLILQINLSHNFTNLYWQQYFDINGSQIVHWVAYRQKWSSIRFKEVIESYDIITNTSTSVSSLLYEFIYPYELYLTKEKLRSKQMDKLFFYHLNTLPSRKNYQIPHSYFQFDGLLQTINNCTVGLFDESETKVTINSQEKWPVCTLTFPTNALIQLKIVPDDFQAKMYVCQSLLQNQNTNPEINCQIFISNQNEKSHYLTNNHMIRFYILRVAKQHKFPTFYFKDIERQQLAFASTIFFYLMLMLSISFFVIIVFIIIKPIIIAVLIYYGWRQDLTAPTYPLGWFQLKIKIKRLVQRKFLRYVPHEPKNEDEDNHCCFCLQNLAKESIIAQLYCQHQFHKECFNEWIKNEPNLRCPTCRRQFTYQQLNDYLSSQQIISE